MHGQALEKQSRALLATGEASIAVPGVILRAHIRARQRCSMICAQPELRVERLACAAATRAKHPEGR